MICTMAHGPAVLEGRPVHAAESPGKGGAVM
jgi:hypothetical protein